MILVDSSVWIDHLRRPDDILLALLAREEVLIHPFVIGEIALGQIRDREAVLADLRTLPGIVVAADDEVMYLVEHQRLFGLGIGYVDAHLLAAVRLTPDARLWTRDRRLHGAANQLGLGARLTN